MIVRKRERLPYMGLSGLRRFALIVLEYDDRQHQQEQQDDGNSRRNRPVGVARELVEKNAPDHLNITATQQIGDDIFAPWPE